MFLIVSALSYGLLHMCVLITQLCLTLCDHGLQPARLLCLWILQARILEWVAIPFSGDLPDPGIELPALQGDSLPREPLGKPLSCCVLVSQLCLTVCDPMRCNMQASLSFTIYWSLFKLMSSELVVPTNHLILCFLFLLPSVLPCLRGFSSE